MNVIILLNGEPYEGIIPAENAYILCCDGAYRWAKGRVRIDETLGDFDSLDEIPVPPPLKVYPSEKDLTDGEIALWRALELKAESIRIYGGGGRREDHFLGNLHLLYKACKAGVPASMITNNAEIAVCEGAAGFACRKGQTVSIIPFGGDAHILSSEGLKYPLEDLWLKYGSTRGISNVTESDEDFSFYSEGAVLVIINQGEV